MIEDPWNLDFACSVLGKKTKIFSQIGDESHGRKQQKSPLKSNRELLIINSYKNIVRKTIHLYNEWPLHFQRSVLGCD